MLTRPTSLKWYFCFVSKFVCLENYLLLTLSHYEESFLKKWDRKCFHSSHNQITNTFLYNKLEVLKIGRKLKVPFNKMYHDAMTLLTFMTFFCASFSYSVVFARQYNWPWYLSVILDYYKIKWWYLFAVSTIGCSSIDLYNYLNVLNLETQ